MANELYTRCSFGAYADNTAGHEALEKRLGAKLKRFVIFQDLPSVGGGDGWPQTDADWCARTGHDLVIAWDIHSNINLNGDQLLRGEIDTQLDSFFEKAKAFPNKVALRMWWEFNDGKGRKVGKNPTAWPGGYAQWRDGWRYVVNRAKANGAHVSKGGNVSFFWCANGSDNTGLRMEEFWPGAEYVDMIGLDTYNDYSAPWTEFADKIQPMMDRILKLPSASSKPLGIGETGSLDTNSGKANWHRNLFMTTRWPGLKVIDFFSTNKEADWRIDYPESLRAVSAEFLPKAPQDAWSGNWGAISGAAGYFLQQTSSSQLKSKIMAAAQRTITLGGLQVRRVRDNRRDRLQRLQGMDGGDDHHQNRGETVRRRDPRGHPRSAEVNKATWRKRPGR